MRLVTEILRANGIAENHIVSIIFSLTQDLTAMNPATGLRRVGFAATPLFCTQEAHIAGGMPRVIRALLDLGVPGAAGSGAGVSRRRRGSPFGPHPREWAVRDPRNVWHVTREYAGIAEAGGVKDVVRGLAEAQARAGGVPRVVMPLYGFMPRTLRDAVKPVASFSVSLPDQDRENALFREEVKVLAHTQGGVRFLLVDSPRFADKRGVYVHTAEDEAENQYKKRGTGHWDALQMNLILQRGALESALALGEIPDVFHCHDGHTAFLPALLRIGERFRRPPGVEWLRCHHPQCRSGLPPGGLGSRRSRGFSPV